MKINQISKTTYLPTTITFETLNELHIFVEHQGNCIGETGIPQDIWVQLRDIVTHSN